VDSIDVSKLNDAFFAKTEVKVAPTKKAGDFFNKDGQKAVVPQARRDEQKRVDTALLATINSVPTLYHYLNAKFSLTNGQFPHAIKF